LTARAVRSRAFRLLLLLVLEVAAAVALFEAGFSLYFAHPVRVPLLHRVGRYIYGTAVRDVIQLDPRYARYDAELFYTLRPGHFVFAQREFETPYDVNSLGVRDDEAALVAPEIIVAGDSVAMGWGVGPDETFARILKSRTGRRVLNASVSSYGTVREMRLLERVDRSALRWLVVQYNANDVGENRVFAAQGNRHLGGNRAKYERTVARYRARRGYYPGRYTVEALGLLAGDVRQSIAPRRPRGPDPTADEEADWFVNALLHAGPVDFERVRVVVFEASGDGVVCALVPTLRRRLAAGTLPAPLRTAIVVDVASRLGVDDFYVLDDHPNARGHRVIADALLAALGPSP
jgi:hypothetical protein